MGIFKKKKKKKEAQIIEIKDDELEVVSGGMISSGNIFDVNKIIDAAAQVIIFTMKEKDE